MTVSCRQNAPAVAPAARPIQRTFLEECDSEGEALTCLMLALATWER